MHGLSEWSGGQQTAEPLFLLIPLGLVRCLSAFSKRGISPETGLQVGPQTKDVWLSDSNDYANSKMDVFKIFSAKECLPAKL